MTKLDIRYEISNKVLNYDKMRWINVNHHKIYIKLYTLLKCSLIIRKTSKKCIRLSDLVIDDFSDIQSLKLLKAIHISSSWTNPNTLLPLGDLKMNLWCHLDRPLPLLIRFLLTRRKPWATRRKQSLTLWVVVMKAYGLVRRKVRNNIFIEFSIPM